MPTKGARGLFPLAFYLAVTVIVSSYGWRITKSYRSLTDTINERQVHTGWIDDAKLKAIQNGTKTCNSQDPACNSAAQILPAWLSPQKRTRLEDDEVISNDKVEDNDASQGPLVPISEAVAAFLEAAFSMKLDNNTRKAKAKADGIPDSCWIQCAKLDSVVSVNVSAAAARVTDKVSTWIQNFWLDAVTPLIFLLEKAEELELQAEVIVRIQTYGAPSVSKSLKITIIKNACI